MIRRVSSTTVRPTPSARPAPAHPGGGGLEDLELGGPRLGLLEQLGVGEGDRGVGGQGRDEGDVAARPGPRLAGDRRQGAEHPVVVHERRDQVAGDLEHGVVRHLCVKLIVADVGVGEDVAGAQDLADPALVAAEDRQAPGQLIWEAGPCRDLEDGHRAGPGSSSRRRAGRAWPRRRPSGRGRPDRARRPDVRRSRGPCRVARRALPRGRGPTVRECWGGAPGRRAGSAASRSDRVIQRTNARAAGADEPLVLGRPLTSRPGQVDRDGRRGARARLDGVTAGTGRGSRHPSWSRVGPSFEVVAGDSGSVDRPSVAGLHSGGVAAPRGHDRQSPHPRSARPVDDGPSPIDGEPAVITRKPLRPAS